MTYKDLPGTEPDVTYAYDLLGRMTSAATSSQTLSFTYDALARNLTQTGPQGTLTSTWDLGGRRTRITHPDTFYIDQDYLVTGELQKIRENGATSGVGVLATYAYDDLGRRSSLTRGDGSSTSYTFDAVSRLTQLAEDLAGTSYDQTLGFSYNPASQITQNTRSNDTYAWTGHYNVNGGYTANGLNQYTASGSVTPTYDTKGNLTSAGGTTYTYSSENLLTSASGGITLSYDPPMRLYQSAGGTPGTTRFQYDAADLIAEYNSSNSLQRRYVHGPGTDEPLVWYEGSGTSDRRFLHTDERGSVVAVGSSAGTSVNSYDEYGIPRSTNTGRFQYTGQTRLPELGMYYYKARIYSPTLGRFLQADPIHYGDGMNVYRYASADPVNRIDPTGLCDVQPCGGVVVNGKRIVHVVFASMTAVGGSEPLNTLLSALVDGDGDASRPIKIEKPKPPKKVTIDRSCVGVGPAFDPGVQAKALEALALAFTAQERDPSGPPTREYGFSGRSYFFQSIFGHGYVTGEIVEGTESNVGLKPGYFDTFDVHTHAGSNQIPGFDTTDTRTTRAGNTSIIIDRFGVLRCYTGGK